MAMSADLYAVVTAPGGDRQHVAGEVTWDHRPDVVRFNFPDFGASRDFPCRDAAQTEAAFRRWMAEHGRTVASIDIGEAV